MANACWLRDGSGNPFASVSGQKIEAYSPVRFGGTAPKDDLILHIYLIHIFE